MVSSASAQIEATGAANLHTTIIGKDGRPQIVSDYATVQGILIGVVAAFVLVITIIGPENYGSHFEKHKTAFEEGGGRDELEEDAHGDAHAGGSGSGSGSMSESRPTSVRVMDEKRSTPEPV